MAKVERGDAMSVNDLLLPEIWHQILTKLPAKSIPRCRSVCKTWYSLISSPNFIADHAAQTLNQSTSNRVLLLHSDPQGNPEKFTSHDESFVESHEHDDLPKQFRSGNVRIVGSCNGLVCLFEVDVHTTPGALVHSFLIWNPSIGKSVQLPFRHSSTFWTLYLFGFGFDSESGDYKVLRSTYGTNFVSEPVVYEIFDLGKGVWRDISPPITPRHVADPESCVYLHGGLHWLGYEDLDHPRHHVIVSFNLSSEVSKEIGMPGDADYKDVRYQESYSISVNNGLLSVALLRWQGDVGQDRCTVWSMKEYGVTESWTKLFCIDLPHKPGLLGLLRFWDNGEVIVSTHKDRDFLVLYNPENRTSKALLSGSADEFIDQVCYYKESLVLL